MASTLAHILDSCYAALARSNAEFVRCALRTQPSLPQMGNGIK